ncbi:MAG: DUF4129 domain-containing protein [Deinococcus sp.]|nr:DUF4129 domain-containing protein [Deinococcus sp.]
MGGFLVVLGAYFPLVSARLSDGWLADLMPALLLVALGWAAVWLLNQAAEQVGEKGSRAWLYLLALGVLAPHPLLLLSLAAALLLRPGPDSALPAPPAARTLAELGTRWRGLGPLLTGFAAALFLSFALPAGSLGAVTQQVLQQAAAQPGSGHQIYQQPICRMIMVDGKWELFGGTPGNWAPAEPADCSFTPLEYLRKVTELTPLEFSARQRHLALVGVVLLLALAVWRARQSRPRQSAVAPAPLPSLEPLAGLEPLPLHRVRAAYARTEAHLAAAGLVRQEAETPAEYLRRVAGEWPGLARPLATLGAVYGPVRYGGGVSEGQADAAEQSAALILAGARPAVPVSSDHSTTDVFPRSERPGPA